MSDALFFCVVFSPQTKDIHLHPELFTVNNGLLTPTMKNKRPALRKAFKETVEALYQKHQL